MTEADRFYTVGKIRLAELALADAVMALSEGRDATARACLDQAMKYITQGLERTGHAKQ